MLARTFQALAPLWRSHAGRSAALAAALQQDMQQAASAAADAAGGAGGGEVSARLLSLAACFTPLALARAGAEPSAAAARAVHDACAAFGRAARHAGVAPSGVQELCGHVSLLACALLKTAAPAAAPQAALPPAGAAPAGRRAGVALRLDVSAGEPGLASALAALGISQPSQERVRARLVVHDVQAAADIAPSAAPSATADWESALVAAVEFVAAGLGRADVAARPATVGALAAALLAWAQLLPRGGAGARVPASLAALCRPGGGAVAALRGASDQAVVMPVARLYVHLATSLPPLLRLLLTETVELGGQGAAAAAAVLAFNLSVLNAAAKQLRDATELRAVWEACDALMQGDLGHALGVRFVAAWGGRARCRREAFFLTAFFGVCVVQAPPPRAQTWPQRWCSCCRARCRLWGRRAAPTPPRWLQRSSLLPSGPPAAATRLPSACCLRCSG